MSRRVFDGSDTEDGGRLAREERRSKRKSVKQHRHELVVSVRVHLTLTTSHLAVALLVVLAVSKPDQYL